jgi:nitric oxide reductase subunit B
VEATWEDLIGCIRALALMQLLGTSRRIVETWIYIEVALVPGTGILGLGHHYFWIGTPNYWLTIGGFFSALEPSRCRCWEWLFTRYTMPARSI